MNKDKEWLLKEKYHGVESPEFFAATLRSDFAKWGKLAREIGFRPQ